MIIVIIIIVIINTTSLCATKSQLELVLYIWVKRFVHIGYKVLLRVSLFAC